MNRKALIKIGLLSIAIAIVLSLVSLLFLNRQATIQSSRFRDEFIVFFSSSLERRIQNLSLVEIRKVAPSLLKDNREFRRPPFGGPGGPPPGGERGGLRGPRDDFRRGDRDEMGPPPPGDMPMPPPPHGMGPGGPRGPGGRPESPQLWLMAEGGEILAKRDDDKESPRWKDLPHPKVSGQVSSNDDFFKLRPSVAVIRLNTTEPVYLVVRDPQKKFLGPLLMTQAILTASMIVIALVIALAAMFFYLRRKSEEARSILRRLEEGDLKARFQIKRFDEFGELMLDFNRMAAEIETLVGRIHATESKRKKLLQELGHDLRTPLTSLKTNFEILQNHHERLSLADKTSLFGVLSGEIDYFKDLIEKLITIASLDEPHYKASTEHINLEEMLKQEAIFRQKGADNKLTWNFHSTGAKSVLGDSHLMLRLLRNGLDNASRYAESTVSIHVSQEDQTVRIEVIDDGPGIADDALKDFGERHEFRGRKMTKGGHFSLGLGSVIMKTVTELHNGQISISNIAKDGKIAGARLVIELPTIDSNL